MSSKYSILDLQQIVRELSDGSVVGLADEYTGQCTVCNEQVSQYDCECPICHTPVVWLNSPTWKALYGNPQRAIQRLNRVPPSEPSGKLLMERTGQPGFANLAEAQRWQRAARLVGEQAAIDTVNFVTLRSRLANRRTYAAVSFALAMLEKKAREIVPQHARTRLPEVEPIHREDFNI